MRFPKYVLLSAAFLISSCASNHIIDGMYTPATAKKAVAGQKVVSTVTPKKKQTSSQQNKKAATPDKETANTSTTNTKHSSVDKKRAAVIATAKKYIGCSYKAATAGPKTFDCSGFTHFVYKQYGVELSRSSSAQYSQGVAVRKSNLKTGDLVFFKGSNAKNPKVGHVGIVVNADSKGSFSFIHAALTGVRIDNIESDYYKTRYLGARRVLE